MEDRYDREAWWAEVNKHRETARKGAAGPAGASPDTEGYCHRCAKFTTGLHNALCEPCWELF